MLSLLLALSLSGPVDAACERVRCPRVRAARPDATAGYAFFEFAPLNGAGMGSACSCAAVTGAKQEAVTFTRSSSGTCLKTIGVAPQAIANSDMVTCSSNQVRVMAGADGTNTLGLLVEAARTNTVLRSQEFDNAAWTKGSFGGASTPTVTADAATAPDGTLTAERIQFGATTGTQQSYLDQGSLGNATVSLSLFLKGNSTSGNLTLITYVGGVGVCTACAYTSSSWSRCTFESKVANLGGHFSFGNDGSNCGGLGDQPAQDVFVWGAQYEVSLFSTSYIATTSASVTRAEDLPLISLAGWSGAGWSAAGTWLAPSTITGGLVWFVLEPSTNTTNRYSITPNTATVLEAFSVVGGSANTTNGPSNLSAGASNRYFVSYDGTNQTVGTNGAAGSPTANGYSAFAVTQIAIGNYQAGGSAGPGVHKRICLDPNPTRCR